MSTIALSNKAGKLSRLFELEGITSPDDLVRTSLKEEACPGICMTEGCDHRIDVEPDQVSGFCEACGGNTIVSGLVLAGLI